MFYNLQSRQKALADLHSMQTEKSPLGRSAYRSAAGLHLLLLALSYISVTKNYFENLVRALETGLKDVGTSNNQATCSKGSSSKSLGNKSKSGKIKAVAGSSSGSGAPSRSFDDGNLWSCDRCTYANPRSTTTCQMCEHHK
ncbi:hypothetical protein GW17_00007892 [Ensete ventricosum]|nr:hypothetical protein GW17_00007892 [Ensete ventricosum]